MQKRKKIRTLEDLKNLCSGHQESIYISLGGKLYSKRDIAYHRDSKTFGILFVGANHYIVQEEEEFIKQNKFLLKEMEEGNVYTK